jgi:hypothetical protein
MITSHAVYNLNPHKLAKSIIGYFFTNFIVKRKIKIEDISSISLSTTSSEFVIHVEKEYDYRYSQS